MFNGSVNLFRNPFFICYLDKHHPTQSEQLLMLVELQISSSHMGVFTRTLFFPILPIGLNFSADGTLVDAWPYFPGLKVGKISILHSSFLTI
jgi:hypothetical protein